MDDTKDSIEELYELVEALETCCNAAPAGLAYILKMVVKKFYKILAAIDGEE
ncbi:hypothetical protein [Maridesulfovibrio sp.]|uniref:hypothetical protein n=1 Tax=Maridesulfovibrio sp. TaxID=2795000 RepID=UPI0029CA1F65|nr:hypothetical protein [Maridesulfovibrio sp.]